MEVQKPNDVSTIFYNLQTLRFYTIMDVSTMFYICTYSFLLCGADIVTREIFIFSLIKISSVIIFRPHHICEICISRKNPLEISHFICLRPTMLIKTYIVSVNLLHVPSGNEEYESMLAYNSVHSF